MNRYAASGEHYSPIAMSNKRITLVVAVTYLIINLLIDISYALLDPRVVR